jgi:hypothetical protein
LRLSFRNLIFVVVIFLVAVLAVPTRAGWMELASYRADSTATAEGVQAIPAPKIGSGQVQPLVKRSSTPELIEEAIRNGEIDKETANLYLAYAISNDPRLPSVYRSEQPWDGTLPLLHLKQELEQMQTGEARSFIESVVTDSCGSNTFLNQTDHFDIHYGQIYGGLTINNYANSLESSWIKQIADFGWARPPGGRYHVVVKGLGTGLYGYVTNTAFVGDNPSTAWNDVDAYASCMVLNNNYSYFGNSQKALDATTAHEFNHSIQFGIGALFGAKVPDENFVEGGATWMEDEVFDSANDNYYYLWPSFTQCMGQYTASPYPYWIAFRGMSEHFGTGVSGGGEQIMQDFWELTSKGISGNLTALNTALSNKGTTLADAFHNYAIAVKFNKTCSGGYAAPYCLEEGPNYVAIAGATPKNGNITSVGGSYSGLIRNNYAINWIGLPNSGVYDVKLQNTASGGAIRASLVCDTGAALIVNPLPSVVTAGQTTTFYGYSSSGCASVVAVLTNQAQTAENPSSCAAHSYQLSANQSLPPTQTPTPTPTATPDVTLDQVIYFPIIVR